MFSSQCSPNAIRFYTTLSQTHSGSHREREMSNGGEALVVCSDKNMGAGITIWGLENGNHLLHIPTCASSPHGLLCLRNQFLVASQIHKNGSVGGGAIFIWPLNKPHAPVRSYPLEAIGPLSCSKDGVYLAGGALSGNAYIWEVANGKLIKNWRAHHKSLKCILFSDDGSLLISGSDDGMICIWSLISLLAIEDSECLPCLLHCSSEHKSSITGMSTTSGISSSILVSSSLDGTCKASMGFDLGKSYTNSRLSTSDNHICSSSSRAPLILWKFRWKNFYEQFRYKTSGGSFCCHRSSTCCASRTQVIQSVTALMFSRSGMVSASLDRTICLWDVNSKTIIRRFNHQKGPVTNLAVIPRSSLQALSNHRKVLNTCHVSMLDKYPQHANASKEKFTLLSSCCSLADSKGSVDFQNPDSCRQILDLEKKWTPAAMQMKLETCIESRMWATRMTKHVMAMNKHLQSRLLDLMQSRLLWSMETGSQPSKKMKRFLVDSSQLEEEDQPQSSC